MFEYRWSGVSNGRPFYRKRKEGLPRTGELKMGSSVVRRISKTREKGGASPQQGVGRGRVDGGPLRRVK